MMQGMTRRLALLLLTTAIATGCASQVSGNPTPTAIEYVAGFDREVCRQAGGSAVAAIISSLDEGLAIDNPVAVAGDSVEYIGANVLGVGGAVIEPLVVWVSDPLDNDTAYSASDAAMSVSLLPDGRGTFGVDSYDQYGALVQECVRNN